MKSEHRIIDEAIEKYSPVKIFAMFSGGHDSLCSTHIAMSHPKCDGVAHINTGIGIEETRQFVRNTCERFGWPLIEKHPPKMTYRDLVLKFGFPGPGAHFIPYRWLKERAIEALLRENKTHRMDRVMFITGVRKQESKRRMGHVEETFKKGGQVWCAPILHWAPEEKQAYMDQHSLPENDVVRILCMSGECLCGAFAKPNELEELEIFFPDAAAQIRGLQEEAGRAGVHAKWGVRPPRKTDRNQGQLPLCWSCESKMENYDGTQEHQQGQARIHGDKEGHQRSEQR